VPRADRLLAAVAVGAAAAAFFCALVRIFEQAVFIEPNPATLIWSDRNPFFWRAAIALYVGGLASFGGYALAARSPRAAARGVLVVFAAAVIVVTLQGALSP
jgi:hypothetical protein